MIAGSDIDGANFRSRKPHGQAVCRFSDQTSCY